MDFNGWSVNNFMKWKQQQPVIIIYAHYCHKDRNCARQQSSVEGVMLA